MELDPAAAPPLVIDLEGLRALVEALQADGWSVIAPTVADGVIAHAEIDSIDDLPHGVGDEQDAAHYRLRERGDDAVFGYAVGPQSWKPVFFPARELLRRIRPNDQAEAAPPEPDRQRRVTLLGVRSCDLHALAVHDRVLLQRLHPDVRYEARREHTLVVAVTCGDPAATCFCASMGTGPAPTDGFDLLLTEVLDADGHRFVVRVGSERGADLARRLPSLDARPSDTVAAAAVVAAAVERMGRRIDTDGLKDLLYANAEHPQWDDVASRCLACSNCTLVCPTCFCTSVEDTTDLATGTADRWRVWDSCFTTEYSRLGSGSVRPSTRARYRQWATHKLASWWDQFGSSGCVGCGRCITWCPAAIDLTAEVAAIRATSSESTEV